AASDEALTAARALIAAGTFRSAMSRIYYAAFHAARALVLSTGAEPKTHEGTHHLLSVEFVKKGLLETRWSRVLAKLQKYREVADYGGSVVFDRAAVEEELAEAEALAARIRSLLDAS